MYIITYLFPFASLAIKDFNIVICVVIASVLIVVAPCINTAIPNPILFFQGYHFYQVSGEHGISGGVLISKRKLRKAKDVKTVNRIFDFLFLDTERRKIATSNDSDVLVNYKASEIKKLARDAGITIVVENKKVVIPNDKEQIKVILGFSDEEAYKGPFSQNTFLANSKRRINK